MIGAKISEACDAQGCDEAIDQEDAVNAPWIKLKTKDFDIIKIH